MAGISDGQVRGLTANQRDMLIDHIDGEMQISVSNRHLVQVRLSLLRAGLLRGWPQNSTRPKTTALTERGREAVGMILGDYADALVRAGLLAQERPLDVLRRLRAMRTGEKCTADGESLVHVSTPKCTSGVDSD